MANKIINGNQIKVGWGKAEDTNVAPAQNDMNKQEPCRNLYVGNIDGDITEEQLYREFSRFGSIEKIKIIPQKVYFISLSLSTLYLNPFTILLSFNVLFIFFYCILLF